MTPSYSDPESESDTSGVDGVARISTDDSRNKTFLMGRSTLTVESSMADAGTEMANNLHTGLLTNRHWYRSAFCVRISSLPTASGSGSEFGKWDLETSKNKR